MKKTLIFFGILLISSSVLQAQHLEGKIIDAGSDDGYGLTGASVYWSGTNKGTNTNEAGYFELGRSRKTNQLIISFIGYHTDTLIISNEEDYIEHILIPSVDLDEVVVTSRNPGAHIARAEATLTVNITGDELCKAACCNLAESFETNASVDVNYSDAVTGAKQIQLLGLSGNYVQMMTENYPNMRGIASPYGLTWVPGSWMESIQVSKGIGSVLNGYEAITGQINVEYKKPKLSEYLFLNALASSAGKREGNLNASVILNDKWSTGILAHAETNNQINDHNDDGFRDKPNVKQYQLMNRWDYITPELTFRSGIKYMEESRIGGQTNYSLSDDDTYSNGYGILIETKRLEGFTKVGKVFNNQWNTGFIQSMAIHEQDSWYGYNRYTGEQDSYYANLIVHWNSADSSGRHAIDFGPSFRFDRYEEYLNTSPLTRNEYVPGIWAQYTYLDQEKMTLMLGLRADNHNQYGLFITPRIHFRYELGESTTLRTSLGKGFRSPNILAENTYLLASSREMVIEEGLKQEEALNMGLNLTHYFEVFGKELRLTGEVYRTSFVNQVVVDLDSRNDQVIFSNLDGESFSNVFQLESQYQIFRGWDMTAAFRLNDVRTTIAGELRSKPLSSRYKGLITTSYQTPLKKWQFDYTVQFNGDGRIPDLGTHPEAHLIGTHFDAFTIMNAQITKYFRRGSFYIGVENLTNFRQKNAILGANDPFGDNFDGSMVWGPIHGRKFYAGLRFAIDRDLSTVQ